jgi:hypothetical protein
MMEDTMLRSIWLWWWRRRRRRSRRNMWRRRKKKKEKKKACCVLLHIFRPFRHRCHRSHFRLGHACPNFIFRLQTIHCSVLLSSKPFRWSKPFLEYLAWTCSCSRPSIAAYHFRCVTIAGVWLKLLTDHVDVVSFDLSRHTSKLGKETFHIHVSWCKDVRVWNIRRILDSGTSWVVLHKNKISNHFVCVCFTSVGGTFYYEIRISRLKLINHMHVVHFQLRDSTVTYCFFYIDIRRKVTRHYVVLSHFVIVSAWHRIMFDC